MKFLLLPTSDAPSWPDSRARTAESDINWIKMLAPFWETSYETNLLRRTWPGWGAAVAEDRCAQDRRWSLGRTEVVASVLSLHQYPLDAHIHSALIKVIDGRLGAIIPPL